MHHLNFCFRKDREFFDIVRNYVTTGGKRRYDNQRRKENQRKEEDGEIRSIRVLLLEWCVQYNVFLCILSFSPDS